MKINKILFGLAIAILGVMTSCDTDVEGALYSPMSQNVSFETKNPAAVTTAETSVTIPVRITRSITTGTYTANFTAVASEDGIFTNDADGAVTFADGQGVAIINVTASNLAKGADYTYTLTLTDAEVATADTITNTQNITTTIKIHSDYNWVSAGSCTFVDYTFSENGDAAQNVSIQYAEGTNIYRIVKPFIAVYGEGPDGFTTDTGIQFTLNDDYTINFIAGNEDVICELSDATDKYSFCWVPGYIGSYCILDCDGNVYEAEMLGLVNGEGYYTGFAFAFEWTTGWPGHQ